MTLKLPRVYRASDYHEFDEIQDTLRKAGAHGARFVEIDTPNPYIAVFYVGSQRDPVNKALIKKEEQKGLKHWDEEEEETE